MRKLEWPACRQPSRAARFSGRILLASVDLHERFSIDFLCGVYTDAHLNYLVSIPVPGAFRPATALGARNRRGLYSFPTAVGQGADGARRFFSKCRYRRYRAHGSISFHALGDSGVATITPLNIADCMQGDVNDAHPELGTAFLLHLVPFPVDKFRAS
jgi:hypothetical protein